MKYSRSIAVNLLLLIAPLTLAANAVWAGEASRPRVFCLSPETLAKARAAVQAGDAALKPALEKLRREAASALKAGPFSVVDNDLVPPSGDKHDYISFGPYWWPDPSKKDGLPYIRRDGEVNPQSRSGGSDSPAMGKMISAVHTLALSYYFTGDQPYAQRAAELLRVWFLRPATKMNPNLNFGQGMSGRMDGRGTGIIDTSGLTRVVDAVGLLATSSAWTTTDQEGIKTWFADYLKWLQTSKYGKAEGKAGNNHGTWYDAQVASFALFVGQDHLAREVIEASRQKRIARQIEPDGRQPAELARTKPFGYSTFNLQALFALAAMGDRVGLDLWHFQTADGRGLQKALDYLAPYVDPERKWPHKDLKFDRLSLIPLLGQAAAVYGEQYRQLLSKLPEKEVAHSAGRLIYHH